MLFRSEGVIQELGLTNLQTLHARAEEWKGRANYDVVTARAVARLPKLLDWILPLVKHGGLAIALKGQEAEEEVREAKEALKRHKARVERIATIPLPQTEIMRKIVLVRSSAT